jgi:formate dehydrogenase major subunit
MIDVTIDGQRYTVSAGETILHAARNAGIDIPALCSDDRLEPSGACRLCVVEVDDRPKPLAACTTPVRDGMRIETRTARLEKSRKTLLSLMAERYPAEHAQAFPEKPLHRYFAAYGLAKELRGSSAAELLDESHPYLRVDMSACIDCYRCVRICNEVQGQFVWEIWNRGDATRIRPDSQTTLLASSCVSCGACADTCPSGAIVDVTRLRYGEATAHTRTTCPYCGVGCQMDAGVRNGRIVEVTPVLDDPVSKGHLCVKGRYAFEYVDAKDRVTEPMIRRNGVLERASWDEALTFAASELKRIVNRYGARSVGVLGSARATNEENYLAQKFARKVLGTSNVDCCARVCHAPTAAALKAMLGTGAATNSFDDIERARTILVCGSNASENHPVVGARIKQAALRGAALIVIDPREIELARYARVHLAPRPGTNVPLFNAIAAAIVREGWIDSEFVKSRVAGFDDFAAFVASWTPERAANICGVDAAAIVEAARLYAQVKPAIVFHGLGVTEQIQGTDGVMALANLALLSGNLGVPGSGINPLRGQNNVQGAALMGCDPENLTGGVPVKEATGLNLMQMMDAAREGRFKALWAIGYDVLLTNPDANGTREALDSLELAIVQDMFLNETAREYATVFLPASSSFEKDGTFMNAERRIGRVRKALEPRGNSKADWEIICRLARTMNCDEGFDFESPRDIWEEIRVVWPAVRGITYERLNEGGLQWPCTSEGDSGTELLHQHTFSGHERAELRCIDFVPSAQGANDTYPYLLMTGRSLYQFNAGTMTGRTRNMELRPSDELDISPADAAHIGAADGTFVSVSSANGSVVLPARVTSSMGAGQVFATFNDPRTYVNLVTGKGRDPATSTPEYKVTAVRLEVVQRDRKAR